MPNDTPRYCSCGHHRPNYRQLRLLQFMREMPADYVLAEWGEHSYRHALWSAAELVEQSGIYSGPRARAACLSDLNHLLHLVEVARFGNGAGTRWSIGEAYRA